MEEKRDEHKNYFFPLTGFYGILASKFISITNKHFIYFQSTARPLSKL